MMAEEYFKKNFLFNKMEKNVRFREDSDKKSQEIPLTSYVSTKFLDANKFRSNYDLRMLKLYDSSEVVEDYVQKSKKKHTMYH